MQVIPVIDLKEHVVVRGIAGRREEYRPVVSRLTADSSPGGVAKAFAEEFGLGQAYVADLDAIAGQSPDVASYLAIAEWLPELWIDAGVGDCAKAAALLAACRQQELNVHAVVGLESLTSDQALAEIVRAWGSERVVLSLDLKQGQPITRIAAWKSAVPLETVAGAVERGIGRVLVLDLADVGVQKGTSTLELIRGIRREYPRLEIIAGGGVRGPDDLRSLAAAGADAALVA